MQLKRLWMFIVILLGSASLMGQSPRLQAVHSVPDPGLSTIDVYISLFGTTVQEIQDVTFRSANPMTAAPIPFPLTLDFGIAPGNSTSSNDVIASFPIPLEMGKTYIGIARGVQNPGNFAPNPDGLSTALSFTLTDQGRTVSTQAGKVQFQFAHMVTDAPTVDLVTATGDVVADNIQYGTLTGYLTRDALAQTYLVKDQAGNVLKTFDVNLSAFADSAFTLMMSGFVNPAQNQNGEPVALQGVFGGGSIVSFPEVLPNQPPYVANPISDQNLNEDFASFTVANLSQVFADDDSPALTYSAVSDGNTAVSIAGTNLILSSVPNFFGTSQVTVTASDGEFSVNDVFNVNIANVNDPPVLAGIPDINFNEDEQGTLSLTPYISDIDNSVSGITLSASVVNNIGVQVSINQTTQTATITGNSNFSGQATVIFTATDPGGLSDTDEIVVTVNPVNDPPVIAGVPDVSFDEEDQEIIGLTPYLSDVDNSVAQLTVAAAVLSGGVQVSINQTTKTATISGNTDFFGQATVVFTATDPGGLSDTDTITVTVNNINDAPVLAGAPDVTFVEDGQEAVPLADYLSDSDNSLAEITVSATSSNSSVLVAVDPATKVATISAAPEFSGQSTVIFTASDPGGLSDTDTVEVTVTIVNDPPVLAGIPDISFIENGTDTLEIAPYLSDVDNNISEITLSAAVQNNAGVQVTIDPATKTAFFSGEPDYSGIATVVFFATDPGGATGSDTMLVTVINSNNPPVIAGVPDVNFNEDAQTAVAISPFISDIDNNIAEITLTAQVLNDTSVHVAINPATKEATFSAAPDYFGQANVVFTVTDPENDSDTDTVLVTINPVNDRPVLAGIPDVTIDEDTQFSLDIDDYLVDVDNANSEITLTVNVLNSNIFVDIDPVTHVATFYGAPEFSGQATAIFIARDPGGLADNDAVIVRILTVNDPPVLSGIPDVTFNEESLTALTLTDYASDVDNATSELTFSAQVLNSAGITITIDPVFKVATLRGNKDFAGEVNAVFTATDPGGATGSDTILVTVVNINDAPVLTGIPDLNLPEDVPGTLRLNDYLTDVDNDTSEIELAATVISATLAGGSLSALVDTSDLQIDIDPVSHVATFTTTTDTSGVFMAVFSARDPGGLTDSDTITVTISAVNDAPVIAGLPDVTFDEDSSATLNLNAYFSDPDNANNELTLSAAVSDGSALSVTINTANVASFAIAPDSSGSFEVVFTVTDPAGAAGSDTIAVTVNPVNDAPLLSGIPDLNLLEDQAIALRLNHFLSDVDNDSAEISFTARVISAAPPTVNGVLVDTSDLHIEIDPQTNIALITTSMDSAGVFVATFIATDPGGLSASDTITVMVSPVNDPPQVINPIADIEIPEDSGTMTVVTDLRTVFRDADGNSLSFFASAGTGVIASVNGNALRIAPDPDFFGEAEVVVAAFDGMATASDTFMVTVINVNDAPAAFNLLSPTDSTTFGDPGLPVDFSWSAAADVDGDAVSYTFYLTGADRDTTIANINDTTLVFDGIGFWQSTGEYTWYVVAGDGSATTRSTDTFTIFAPEWLGVGDDLANSIPQAFSLDQNYPNPFNPVTTIRFGVPNAADVSIVIYNSAGQKVRTLTANNYPPGFHQLQWDGRNDSGETVASGFYLYMLRTDGFQQVQKMLLLK